ncbi:MAG: hypothetical protein AAGK37_12200 [Pseudomonadota bacterium]
MVGPSKILTVSYGTFSCTLEGFDDPFSTMRGIAEYFRDLAADDRYFGAEPPTPDADMLHQIAQREVKRRVEAQVEDNGITLRQVEQQPAAATTASETYAEDDAGENMFADIGVDTSAQSGDADDEAEAAEAATVGTFGDAEPVDSVPSAFDDNSVAAKLSRIRAVVSRGSANPATVAEFSGPIEKAFEGPAPAHPATDAEMHGVDTQDVEELEPDAAAVEEPDVFDVVDQEPAAETPVTDAEADASVADEAVEEDTSPATEDRVAKEDEVAEAAAGSEPSGDPIAQSEDEVVGEAPETDDTETAVAEFDENDPWAAAPQDILAGEPTDSPEAERDDTGSDEQEEAAETDNSLAARIVRLKRAALSVAEDGNVADPAETEDTADPAEAGSDAQPNENADLADVPIASDPQADDSETPNDLPEDGDALFAAFDAEDSVVDADNAAEPETETAAEADTADAESASPEDEDRVEASADSEDDLDIDDLIGRKPREPEAFEEEVEAAPEPEEPAVSEEDSLAAMKAAIAEATSAIGSHIADEPQDETDEVAEDGPQKKAAFDQREEPGDAAFDRILEQTNSRMDDSEGNRRRSAIAHLKAAVAATKADRLLKRIKQPEEQDAEDQSQYRDDLAKVVRPRRAESEEREEKTERPEMLEGGASPLMLVSELRVDEDGADQAEAIAPRRVDSKPLDLDEDQMDAGFVEFAEKMGATELPDLLEAAAAYSAFVEGRKEFSRPQLMRAVASVDNGEFSREAGLRSFGQLLRQGKIQKLKRGQFTITAETRFNPEARIAGE